MSTEDIESNPLLDAAARAAMASLRNAGVVHQVPDTTPPTQTAATTQAADTAEAVMAQLAEAALKYQHQTSSDTATVTTPPLTLVEGGTDAPVEQSIGEKTDDANIESVRKGALVLLDDMLKDQVIGSDAYKDIKELIRRVSTTMDKGAIATAVADALSKVSAATDKADDKVVDINSAHKDLYETSKAYRDDTDRISAAAKKSISKLDEALAETDKLAKDLGYTTSEDDNVIELRKNWEDASKSGTTAVAAREAQILYLRALEKQNMLRAQEARKNGDEELAKKFETTAATAIRTAKEEAVTFYNEQAASFLKEYELGLRDPKKNLKFTEKEIKNMVEHERLDLENRLKSIQGTPDTQRADAIFTGANKLKEDRERLEKERERAEDSRADKNHNISFSPLQVSMADVVSQPVPNKPRDTKAQQSGTIDVG